MNEDLARQKQTNEDGSDNEDGPTSARSLITFSSENEKRLSHQYEQKEEKERQRQFHA